MSTITATIPVRTPAPAPLPWRPVTIGDRGPWARKGSVQSLAVHAADSVGNAPAVGEVWSDTAGQWHAYRADESTVSDGHATAYGALSAVGFLPAVAARELVALSERRHGVSVVLADGTPVRVYNAAPCSQRDAARRALAVRPPWLALTQLFVFTDGPTVRLARPRPLVYTGATVERVTGLWAPSFMVGDRDSVPAYRIVLPSASPVALAPTCLGCEAPAGHECFPWCHAPTF